MNSLLSHLDSIAVVAVSAAAIILFVCIIVASRPPPADPRARRVNIFVEARGASARNDARQRAHRGNWQSSSDGQSPTGQAPNAGVPALATDFTATR